jgi:type IV pilus assembly protein PilY1
MTTIPRLNRRLGSSHLLPFALLAGAILLWPRSANPEADDDLFLFTTSVPPNVMIVLDNSGSMNGMVWHEAYDPTVVPTCADFVDGATYGVNNSFNHTACGRTHKIYHDTSSVGFSLYSGRYLNWYFSPEADPYIAEIDDNSNGVRVCSGPGSPTYAKYQRNRLSAAKQVVLDTICRVEATKTVRFGLSVFREPMDATGTDPNGGYAEVAIDDQTPAHASDLEASIANSKADTWTPLSETLFQLYTYFMSRDSSEVPEGLSGDDFPTYEYSRSPSDGGGKFDAGGPPNVPDSPVQFSCQKHFVIIITDGEPTMDDFNADPASTAKGFVKFDGLIGDYNGDGEVENLGTGDKKTLYLDDVAKFMHEKDFRPDMDGEQTLDVYTIGFTTTGAANDLLEKTAQVGNGLFFTSNNADELTQAIVAAITDIIEKSQSFTAATVPSTRTSEGGNFYTSYFLPSGKTPFWEGHLRLYSVTAAGDIWDKNGNCALLDLDPGECNSGAFDPAAVPFWDAGEEVPSPAARNLYTVELSGGMPTRVPFNSALDAADLGLEVFAAPPAAAPNPNYLNSNALNEEGLADEIVAYARGCEFGTGVSGADVAADVPCTQRPWRLGDIFHSSPVVVAQPRAHLMEPSYTAFKSKYATRPRVIYAGANDGFLHAFDAGIWDAGAVPPAYTKGTGTELFGLMPWESKQTIKNLPIDAPDSRHYYVDGSPQAADVWIYPTPTTKTKAADGSEWRTLLMGGLRQGGRTYYALDVTDPADPSYPVYLGEFPAEDDTDDILDPESWLPYLGESWSQPVITRVRVKRTRTATSESATSDGWPSWVADST